MPNSAPGPRSFKSSSAKAKPSWDFTTACKRGLLFCVSAETMRKHVPGKLPRPMRPRSWCSCAKPNRSAPSMTMTVAFGTSIPTSTTGVATSTSIFPLAKSSSVCVLVLAGSCPWSKPMRAFPKEPSASRAAVSVAACTQVGLTQ